jgi:hypothetical protein
MAYLAGLQVARVNNVHYTVNITIHRGHEQT